MAAVSRAPRSARAKGCDRRSDRGIRSISPDRLPFQRGLIADHRPTRWQDRPRPRSGRRRPHPALLSARSAHRSETCAGTPPAPARLMSPGTITSITSVSDGSCPAWSERGLAQQVHRPRRRWRAASASSPLRPPGSAPDGASLSRAREAERQLRFKLGDAIGICPKTVCAPMAFGRPAEAAVVSATAINMRR